MKIVFGKEDRSLPERAAVQVSIQNPQVRKDQKETFVHPPLGNQNQALTERADLYRYDELETETGMMMGFGDATDYTYLDNLTPTNDYLVERAIRFPAERVEMPFMVKSSRGPTGCGHDAFIWLRGAWTNVLVSTILNELGTHQRQSLIDHLDRWLRAGQNPGLERRHPETPSEEDQR